MKRFIILLFLTIQSSFLYSIKAQDTLDDFRQHTTWGFTTGVNILNYSLNLESAVGAPDRAAPGIGSEAALFLDYHISQPCALRFAPSIGMEHINLYKGNDDGHLFTFVLELGIAFEYSIPLQSSRQLNILFGPYSHFVLASTLYGSDELRNPYSRTTVSVVTDSQTDPVIEQPSFAIGDLNSGIALAVAYQMQSLWFIQLDLKYGITDLLNTDSHRLYVQPFKALLSVGRRFK